MTFEELQALKGRWWKVQAEAPPWLREDMYRLITWAEGESERILEARAQGAESMQLAAIKALASLWDQGAVNLVAAIKKEQS